MASRFVVGIDLGTTNSALAYVDTGAGQGREGDAVPDPAGRRPRRGRGPPAAAVVPLPARRRASSRPGR